MVCEATAIFSGSPLFHLLSWPKKVCMVSVLATVNLSGAPILFLSSIYPSMTDSEIDVGVYTTDKVVQNICNTPKT